MKKAIAASLVLTISGCSLEHAVGNYAGALADHGNDQVHYLHDGHIKNEMLYCPVRISLDDYYRPR